MATDALGITDIENKQIAALDAGATPEEASLNGRLQTITPVEIGDGSEQNLSGLLSTDEGSSLSEIVSNTSQDITEDVLRKNAMDLALLKQSIRPSATEVGNDYYSSIEELRTSSNHEEVFSLYQKQYSDLQKGFAYDALLEAAGLGQLPVKEVAETIEVFDELEEGFSGVAGREKIFTDNFGGPSFTVDQLDYRAASNFAFSETVKWADTRSLLRDTGDVFGLLLAPDFLKDAADLVGKGPISTKEKVMDFIFNYNLMTPEQQVESFPAILEEVKIAYDHNQFKVLRFVGMMHSVDPSDEFSVGVVEDAFQIATASTLGGAMKMGRGLIRAKRLQNKLKDIGAIDDASILNGMSKVKTNDTPAKAAVGSELEEAITASPYKMEEHIVGVGSSDGLSDTIIRQQDALKKDALAEIERDIEAPLEVVRARDKALQIETLKTTEKDKRVGEEIRLIIDEAEEADSLLVRNVEEVDRNENGFKLKYETVENGGAKIREREFLWKEGDAGTFFPESTGFEKKSRLFNNPIMSKVFSPLIKLFHVDSSILENTTLGGLQSSIIKKQLTIVANNINKGLSQKEVGLVERITIAGDEYLNEAGENASKVFSIADLAVGIETRAGIEAVTDPKLVKAYYKKVALGQELWGLRNYTVRSQLQFQGAKELSYKKGDDTLKSVVIPKKDFRGVDVGENDLVLTPQINDAGFSTRDSLDFKKLKEEGFVPVRLVDEFSVNGKRVQWGIVKEGGEESTATFGSLPHEVVHNIPGQVSRIYEPGYYYVKDIMTGSTMRAFSSKRQADAWRKTEQVKFDGVRQEASELSLSNPEIAVPDSVNFQTFRDRDFDSYQALIEDASSYGGIYTSPRKKTPLLLDEEGKKLGRLGWGEATQRSINSVSDIMPLNKYRMSLKKRWENSVQQVATAQGLDKNPLLSEDWKTTNLSGISDTTTRQMLLDTRDYLTDQFKVWSKDERLWNKTMHTFIENMGLTGGKARFAIKHFAQRSPLDVAHSLAFQAHMGWFNPRQLYVQSQNASLAISMHPKLGVNATSKMFVMRTAVFAEDRHLVSLLKMAEGKDPGRIAELAEDVRLFRRSGLMDSILRTPEAQAYAEGVVPGTKKAIQSLSKAGLTIYEEGELIGRLTAFNIAKAKWSALNPGKKVLDDDLKEIIADTLRMHMNMQSESAAWWQRSALTKNATQFQQVQAKTIENILLALKSPKGTKGVWTKKDAAQVAAGQIVMYGTLGVPLAGGVTNYLIDSFGVDPVTLEKENPLLAEALADGAQGMFGQLLGFDNQFGGDTASIFASLDENIVIGIYKSVMNSEPYNQDTVGDLAFGPSVNVASRGKDLVINTVNSVRALVATPSLETAQGGLLRFTDDFLAMSSTWSNARKGRWLIQNNKLWSKSGNVILGEDDLKGVNLRSKILAGMGIPLDVEAAYWASSKENRSNSQDISGVKADWTKALVQFQKDGNFGLYQGLVGSLVSGGQYTQDEIIDIRDAVFNKLLDGEASSAVEKESRKALIAFIRSGGRIQMPLGLSNIEDAKTKEGNE